MRDGTLGSITSRDEFIIAAALATALVALEELPPTRQPTRNIADMKMLLNSLYRPSDVSIHLTTARWRFFPNLRPLGARESQRETSQGAMMKTTDNFRQLAAYNRWANSRLYAAALDLSDQSYRLHIGVFFGNLHGTLNHLLLTDRLWLKRLTGEGDHPSRLDEILYEDRAALTRARIAEDNRLIAVVDKYDEAALANLHSYKTTSGMPQS